MNKLIRTNQKHNHFLKRVRLYSACFNEKWVELIKEHYMQVYRNTGSPCSCYLCRGERYSKQDRREAREAIREELNKLDKVA